MSVDDGDDDWDAVTGNKRRAKRKRGLALLLHDLFESEKHPWYERDDIVERVSLMAGMESHDSDDIDRVAEKIQTLCHITDATTRQEILREDADLKMIHNELGGDALSRLARVSDTGILFGECPEADALAARDPRHFCFFPTSRSRGWSLPKPQRSHEEESRIQALEEQIHWFPPMPWYDKAKAEIRKQMTDVDKDYQKRLHEFEDDKVDELRLKLHPDKRDLMMLLNSAPLQEALRQAMDESPVSSIRLVKAAGRF